jgi:hypothetical protein
MKRAVVLALAALCCAATVNLPSAGAKDAGCITVRTDDGTPLVFYKQHMKCSTAKKYAHRLMRDGSYDPKNFKCQRHSPTQGGCTHKQRPRKFFIFYPEH